MDNQSRLKQKILTTLPSIPHSRIHKLKTFNAPETNCLIKRDDELGFGISGSKLRKYSSLIPFLLSQKVQAAVVIGSAYSNHVLGISQLLIENQIAPILFLLGVPTTKRQGNLLLTSMLVPQSDFHWVSRKDWPQVEALAAEFAQQNRQRAAVIPEGACMEASLPGAMTLALDILQNEQESQLHFDHLFMDAGTALSAIATVLAFAWLAKKVVVHILLLADGETQFLEKLKQYHKVFELFMGAKLEWSAILLRYKVYQPSQARSFGSVNATLLNHIKFLARKEGFFTDPIYSAKLFLEAKNIIKNQVLTGNILIVHSGGALTLMGFQKQLSSDSILSP